MTVQDLQDSLKLTPLAIPDPDRQVSSGYCGDLLSWVMGRADPNCAWITIMSNLNIVAVAKLVDASVIILSEDVTLDDGVPELAEQKGVNIFTSELSSFELCSAVKRLL
jgi:hypothetical protein